MLLHIYRQIAYVSERGYEENRRGDADNFEYGFTDLFFLFDFDSASGQNCGAVFFKYAFCLFRQFSFGFSVCHDDHLSL